MLMNQCERSLVNYSIILKEKALPSPGILLEIGKKKQRLVTLVCTYFAHIIGIFHCLKSF